jgi:hypothetical protein
MAHVKNASTDCNLCKFIHRMLEMFIGLPRSGTPCWPRSIPQRLVLWGGSALERRRSSAAINKPRQIHQVTLTQKSYLLSLSLSHSLFLSLLLYLVLYVFLSHSLPHCLSIFIHLLLFSLILSFISRCKFCLMFMAVNLLRSYYLSPEVIALSWFTIVGFLHELSHAGFSL